MGHKPFQELRDKMKDHKEIWLEPRPIPPADQDNRTWCQNNEYEGRKPTRYVRADLLEAAEQKLRKFVWGENNPSEYVNALDKAEATIKEVSELIAYYRDIDAENPDETIRMIAVADELQTILNRSKS